MDDDSPDGTGILADEFAAAHPSKVNVLHRKGERGLGSAYRLGFQHALSLGVGAIVQMDSDFSHQPEMLVTMLEKLTSADGVIGSRYVPGGSLDEKWPIWRKGLSHWGNFYARSILSIRLKDVTGGFRVWKSEVIRAIPWERIRSNGYVFQIETLYVAMRLGYSFAEVPIHFADRTWGQSKLNWRIQFEAAWRVWWVLYTYRKLGPRASR